MREAAFKCPTPLSHQALPWYTCSHSSPPARQPAIPNEEQRRLALKHFRFQHQTLPNVMTPMCLELRKSAAPHIPDIMSLAPHLKLFYFHEVLQNCPQKPLCASSGWQQQAARSNKRQTFFVKHFDNHICNYFL